MPEIAPPAEITDPRTITPAPWANGLGSTRALRHGQGWVLSLANIHEEARFSRFVGVDRCLIVSTGVVRLTIDGVGHELRTGDAVHFAGEADAVGASPSGAQVVNLRLDRDDVFHSHTIQPVNGTLEVDGPTAVVVLGGPAWVGNVGVSPGSVLSPVLAGTAIHSETAMVASLTIHRIPQLN